VIERVLSAMRLLRVSYPFLIALSLASPVRAETIRLFAAASLTETFREIAAGFEKGHPGDRVELNFAGSQTLRTQIEQGASADLFAAADRAEMEPLRKAGLVRSVRIFARNRLAVVAPTGRAAVRRLRDLTRPGLRIVVAAPSVPAGRYTLQALSKMEASALYGAGFRKQVLANVVSRENSVRAVLSKVALGEADAGFVYVTDAATQRKKVRAFALPERVNVVAAYPIAVTARSRSPRLAEAFVRELLGPRGRAALRRRGFQ
jgi:molybdate transport system substrate-binding protein